MNIKNTGFSALLRALEGHGLVTNAIYNFSNAVFGFKIECFSMQQIFLCACKIAIARDKVSYYLSNHTSSSLFRYFHCCVV
jgi:hypothetical protein